MGNKLGGKVALVAGGAGEVGEGVVRAFLGEGAKVIVPSRSPEKLEGLRSRLGAEGGKNLFTVVGEVGSVEGAGHVRLEVSVRFGGLDVVVASLGGWWQGARLTSVPAESWRRVLDDNLTSHFVIAGAFAPLLREGGCYLFINGGAALQPVPQAGPVSIASAAQLMMKDVLAAEEKHLRVYSLVLNTPVITRSRPRGPEGWLTADEVGLYAARLASPAGARASGETVTIDGSTRTAGIG